MRGVILSRPCRGAATLLMISAILCSCSSNQTAETAPAPARVIKAAPAATTPFGSPDSSTNQIPVTKSQHQ